MRFIQSGACRLLALTNFLRDGQAMRQPARSHLKLLGISLLNCHSGSQTEWQQRSHKS
jgi:hypothetical protein